VSELQFGLVATACVLTLLVALYLGITWAMEDSDAE
jgi:hypothetical protein